MFFKILFCLQVIWEKWLYEEDAFSELFIFIVFKNNNKVKINKIITLHSHIFILLLFSEKKCVYVSTWCWFLAAGLTSWGEGASITLFSHPSIDGVTIKMPYGLDVLHQPASHAIFSYWVG